MATRFRAKLWASREKELLSVAEQMLAESGNGCRDFSTTELSRKVGVGKGTVYAHFKTQRQLLETVLSRVGERLRIGVQSEDNTFDQNSLTLQIVDSIASSPAGSLGYPCCLRLLPCPYNACENFLQPLRAVIERDTKRAVVRVDAGLSVCFFHYLLAAAKYHRNGTDELRSSLLTAERVWMSGMKLLTKGGS